jgi:hypothetical protein
MRSGGRHEEALIVPLQVGGCTGEGLMGSKGRRTNKRRKRKRRKWKASREW